MNRRAAALTLAAVALLIVAGATWVGHGVRQDVSTPAHAPVVVATAEAAPATVQSVEPEAADSNVGRSRATAAAVAVHPQAQQAYAAGRTHWRRREDAWLRLLTRQIGSDLVALQGLPLPDAVRALEELLADGDPHALEVLQDLLSRCTYNERKHDFRVVADHVAQDLDPVAAAFVRGSIDAEAEQAAKYAEACRANGLGTSYLADRARERLAGQGKPIPLGPNGKPLNDYGLVRAVFPHEPVPWTRSPHRALIERASPRPGETPLSEDEWITLLAAAADDADVAIALASCAAQGDRCRGLPEPLTNGPRLLRRAAELGDVPALDRLARALQETPLSLVQAYGWALFGRWVIASGCDPIPTSYEYAINAQLLAELEADLSAGARAQGAAFGNALIARYGPGYRQYRQCPP